MKIWCGLGALLVLLVTCVPSTNQQTSNPYGDLPQASGNVTSLITVDISAIQPLFNAGINFINIVLISLAEFRVFLQTYVNGVTIDVNQLAQDWGKIANSTAGFAACIVFGLLFIILVPIVGLFMCCCRTCCNTCGGKMKQTKKRRKSKWQYCFCVSLLIIATLIFVPAVLVFYTNDLTTKVINDLPDETVRILGYASQYLDMVDSQLNYMVTQYDVFSTTVVGEVNDLRNTLGTPIENDILAIASPAITQVSALNSTTLAYTAQLRQYQNARAAMVTLNSDLTTFQSAFATDFPNTAACGGNADCESARTQIGALGPGFTPVSKDAATELGAADTWLGSHGMYVGGYATLFNGPLNTIMNNAFSNNNIAGTVNNTLQSSKSVVTSQTTGLTVFNELNTSITDAQTGARNTFNDIKYYDYIRWAVAVALSVFLLFISLCYLVGILLGTCCGSKDELPTQRGTASNLGGILLMSGVGLTFMFSWLLMILVTLTFMVGAPLERYICQGLSAPYDGLKLVDDFVNLNLGSGINTTITNLVVSCQNDTGAIDAIGLGSTLNLPAIKSDVLSNFQSVNYVVNVNLNTVFKLNNTQLQNAVTALGSNSILTALTGVTALTAPDYSTLIASMQSAEAALTGASKTNMATHLATLQTISSNYNTNFAQWNSGWNYVQTNGPTIEASRATTVANCQTADDRIGSEVDTIINTRVGELNTTILNHVNTFLDWVVFEGETNLGNCRLVYDMYSEFVSLFCSYIINFWNAFWFSLGWAMFFILPAAIIAMKLAKFYRRMDETDHVDPPDHLMMPMGVTNEKGSFNGMILDETLQAKIPRARINKVTPEI